jgi:hypothetical protein
MLLADFYLLSLPWDGDIARVKEERASEGLNLWGKMDRKNGLSIQ